MTDGSPSAEASPSDTIRYRGDETRLKLRVLLESERWTVAGSVVAAFLPGTLAAAALLPDGVVVTAGDPVETLF